MKKKKTIRQIVREEVAMAIQEVITELKKPVKVEKPMTPKKRTQNSSFTSNKVFLIREILSIISSVGVINDEKSYKYSFTKSLSDIKIYIN